MSVNITRYELVTPLARYRSYMLRDTYLLFDLSTQPWLNSSRTFLGSTENSPLPGLVNTQKITMETALHFSPKLSPRQSPFQSSSNVSNKNILCSRTWSATTVLTKTLSRGFGFPVPNDWHRGSPPLGFPTKTPKMTSVGPLPLRQLALSPRLSFTDSPESVPQ